MILKEYSESAASTSDSEDCDDESEWEHYGVIIIITIISYYYYSLQINKIYFYGIINLRFSPYSQKSQNLVLAKFYCLKVIV